MDLYHAGVIASTVINANPFRKEGARLANPLDFVPDWQHKVPQPQGQSTEDVVRILTAAFGCGPGKAN